MRIFRKLSNSKIFKLEEFISETNKTDAFSSMINPQRHLYAQKLDIESFPDKVIDSSFVRPPRLQHNLDKILRTEGIYKVEELTKLNGDSFLSEIHPYDKTFLSKLPQYTPPSKDTTLQEKALQENCKYFTGSSSITEALQHLYYAVSNFKTPDVSGLGRSYDNKTMNYMSVYRKPIVFCLRKMDNGCYALDGDKEIVPASNVILSELGVVLETMFTTDQATFKNLLDPAKSLSEDQKEMLENSSRSFRYRKLGKFLVRNQIDCEGISDTGEYFVFEIKTRAVAPIRYDVKNYQLYLDYEIGSREGVHSSYEREYFDILRSLNLKYFFQIKLGRMDGALLAYHNTDKIFGFEYVKLQEIEKRIFGVPGFSDLILKITTCLLEDILDQVTGLFPDYPMLKIGLYANYRKDEMLITVETFDEATSWKDKSEPMEDVEDEMDYYNKFHPNKTVFTLGRRIFPYINGILQKEPVFLDPGDHFEVRTQKYLKGGMSFNEYMNFLHAAYKFDSNISNREYSGMWKKFNDFHVYRKHLYKRM